MFIKLQYFNINQLLILDKFFGSLQLSPLGDGDSDYGICEVLDGDFVGCWATGPSDEACRDIEPPGCYYAAVPVALFGTLPYNE